MWILWFWFWIAITLGIIGLIKDELNHENPSRKLRANIIALIIIIWILVLIW
jgi:hypothetical protein